MVLELFSIFVSLFRSVFLIHPTLDLLFDLGPTDHRPLSGLGPLGVPLTQHQVHDLRGRFLAQFFSDRLISLTLGLRLEVALC